MEDPAREGIVISSISIIHNFMNFCSSHLFIYLKYLWQFLFAKFPKWFTKLFF